MLTVSSPITASHVLGSLTYTDKHYLTIFSDGSGLLVSVFDPECGFASNSARLVEDWEVPSILERIITER